MIDHIKNLRIVVVDSDEVTRKTIRTHLGGHPRVEIVGEAADLVTGHRLIRQSKPDAVLIEVGGTDDPGMRLAADVHAEMPGVILFVASAHKNSDLIMKAMSVGAREFLLRPLDVHRLIAAIDKAIADPGRLASEPRSHGKVITVFSNKGGVGTTTLATNIACGLASRGNGDVALVDFDLQLGNVTSFLDLSPKYTIYDLVSQIDKVTADSVSGFLAKHSSGVAVLAEPETPAEAEAVTGPHVSRILQLLRSAYGFIVVDTPHGFDERTLEALDASDEIYVVSELLIPTLRNLKRCLDVFRDLQYAHDRIRVVVNRYDPKGLVRLQEVQESLGFEPFWKVPNDFQRVMDGINSGTPVVIGADESPIGQNLLEFSRLISGTENGEAARSGKKGPGVCLKRFFGKRGDE